MNIDAAQFIKSAPAGTMAYARQQTALDAPWMTGFLISEQKWRVQGLGQNPDIELRCGAFEQDGVLLVVALMQVSGELYETWFNYYQTDGGEKYFRDLIEQPAITFAFFAPDPIRVIAVANHLGDFFAQAQARATALKPWSMRDFDAAREKIYQRFPTVSKLWKEVK